MLSKLFLAWTCSTGTSKCKPMQSQHNPKSIYFFITVLPLYENTIVDNPNWALTSPISTQLPAPPSPPPPPPPPPPPCLPHHHRPSLASTAVFSLPPISPEVMIVEYLAEVRTLRVENSLLVLGFQIIRSTSPNHQSSWFPNRQRTGTTVVPVRVEEVEREMAVWGLLGCIEVRLKTLIWGLGVLRMWGVLRQYWFAIPFFQIPRLDLLVECSGYSLLVPLEVVQSFQPSFIE